MIYHQFVTIQTLLNKVCYGFQHTLGSPFLLPYLGYNMMYEPTIHIRDL